MSVLFLEVGALILAAFVLGLVVGWLYWGSSESEHAANAPHHLAPAPSPDPYVSPTHFEYGSIDRSESTHRPDPDYPGPPVHRLGVRTQRLSDWVGRPYPERRETVVVRRGAGMPVEAG